MTDISAADAIAQWPDESREAAQLVIDEYGKPQEVTETMLIWRNAGPWHRIEATRDFTPHEFPAPHIDAVQSYIRYRVPPEKFDEVASFDGSVVLDRTRGEASARCHDVQANFLALNLMNDIVTGAKSVEEARSYYAEEFLNARRGRPTPYMAQLRFQPASDASDGADPDERVLSPEQLQEAVETGQRR